MKPESNTSHEKHLWNAFTEGNEEAYITIYQQFMPLLYTFGTHFTEDRQLVRDCIQDVFVKMYEKRSRLSNVENPKVFLYAAMKNRLFDLFKKERPFVQIDSIEPSFAVDYNIESALIDQEKAKEQSEKVAQALELLSPRQKEAIYYRYIEEMNLEEISKLMNINNQSICNLLQRSMKRIRQAFFIEKRNYDFDKKH